MSAIPQVNEFAVVPPGSVVRRHDTALFLAWKSGIMLPHYRTLERKLDI